jgi:4-amino-4-deoxy-L-arabinose transferase-like glycosyltransferase
MTSRTRVSLVVILVVAAAVRIAWSVYAARPPSQSLHDPNFYLLYGEQIARGNGYVVPFGQGPTAYYPVGYPIVLGIVDFFLIHTVGDHPIGAAAAVNVVCGVAAVALVFAIGRRLANDTVGLVAAAITALYPNLVYHTAAALTETVFNAVFLLLVYLVVSAPWTQRQFERRRVIALGIVLGVCVLIRPVAAPLVGALFVAWLLGGFGWRRAVAYSAAVLGIAALVVSPWIVRNMRVMHSATLSTNTGDNLCMSRHVGASGTFDFNNNACFIGFENVPRPEGETGRDSRNRRLAIDFVRDHPGEEVKLWFKRLYQTFRSDWDGVWAVESYGDSAFMSDSTRQTLRWVGTDYDLATVALAAAGGVIVARRRAERDARWAFVPLAVIAVVVVPVVTTFGDTRFKVPALPLFALLAAVPIAALANRRSPRS